MNSTAIPSPQTRKWDKILYILKWIERWGVTDIHVIQRLQGCSRKTAYQTIKMMLSLGLIRTYRIATCPVTVIALTSVGLRYLLDHLEVTSSVYNPPTSPSLMPRTPAHDLIAQNVLLDVRDENHSEHGLRVVRFITLKGEQRKKEKIVDGMREGLVVIPDAILTMKSDDGRTWRMAIEVQESRESAETAERRISNYGILQRDSLIEDVYWASTSTEIVHQLEHLIGSPVRHFSPEHKEIRTSYGDQEVRKSLTLWTPMPGVPKFEVQNQMVRRYDHLRARYYHDGGSRGAAIML